MEIQNFCFRDPKIRTDKHRYLPDLFHNYKLVSKGRERGLSSGFPSITWQKSILLFKVHLKVFSEFTKTFAGHVMYAYEPYFESDYFKRLASLKYTFKYISAGFLSKKHRIRKLLILFRNWYGVVSRTGRNGIFSVLIIKDFFHNVSCTFYVYFQSEHGTHVLTYVILKTFDSWIIFNIRVPTLHPPPPLKNPANATVKLTMSP